MNTRHTFQERAERPLLLKVRDHIPVPVRNVLAAVGLSVEIVLNASLASSLALTAFSPGTIVQKVESGLKAPGKIYEYLANIPKDIENVAKLRTLLDEPWSPHKIRELTTLGKKELQRVYTTEKERITHLSQGYKNFSDTPIQTLVSMFIVFTIYSVLLGFFHTVRLGTRDTIPTKIRKKVTLLLGLDTDIADMSDEELGRLLERLQAEISFRASGGQN